jgi:hypothetical protein
MRDAIGAVAVTEYESMTERQLPAYGIGAQIDPWAFPGFHVLIVSNLGAKTADRDKMIHSALPRALARFPMSIHQAVPLEKDRKREEPVDEASFVV